MGGHGGIGVHIGVRILRGAPGWLAESAYAPSIASLPTVGINATVRLST